MSDGHEWCRDTARDEAVRAAEDAAAVPAIQHRDLPEQVALLWASVTDILGRVVRIEGEMDAGEAEEAAPAAGEPEPRGWLTAEERAWLKETLGRCRKNRDARLDEGNVQGAKLVGETCEMLTALLARSSPPRVKVPKYFPMSWAHERDSSWIAAIREAGGEVEVENE